MRHSDKNEVHAMPYNCGFDLLKLILSLAIVCLHVNWQTVPHGYLAVEVFFVMSGYFFIKSGNFRNRASTIFLNLLNKTYIKYALSLTLFFLVQLPLSYSSWDYFVAFSMLQGTILKDGLMNPPTWFLCVLIWTLPIFSISNKLRNHYKIILFTSIITISYLLLFINSPSGGLNAVFEFSAGWITSAQMRCFGGLALGCLLGTLNFKIENRNLAAITFLLSISLSLALMEGVVNNPKSDYLILLTSSVLMISTDSIKFKINKKIGTALKKHLSTITISVFLYHYPIFLIIDRLIPNVSYTIKIALITLSAAAVGLIMSASFVSIKKAGLTPLLSLQFRKLKI